MKWCFPTDDNCMALTNIAHPVHQFLDRQRSISQKVADWITAFAGSMLFVYLHVVAFIVWMLLVETNPWPTLTLVVSLEAIFLATFVMIGQNRTSEIDRLQANHDFAMNREALALVRALHADFHGEDCTKCLAGIENI